MSDSNQDFNPQPNNFSFLFVFAAFLAILVGCYLIHPGLAMIASGMYIINILTSNTALINVYLQMPQNFKDVEEFLDILKDEKEESSNNMEEDPKDSDESSEKKDDLV